MATIAEELAAFAEDLQLDSLPRDTVDLGKRCLLDTLGALLAGCHKSETGRIARSYAEDLGERGRCTVAGVAGQTNAATAALAGGMMAHALELDDGSKHATYHPGSSIVPTALALAEERSLSGRELLEAIIAGYETSLRIGTAINPSHYLRGFHPTGTVAAFGTTTAAGKLLGLSAEELANAFGLAGSLASGINQYEIEGSLVKHLHPGNAAKNGILAARLAAKGCTGPKQVVEGKLGFCHCFADEARPETITDQLGSDWHLRRIYVKPFCSCRYVHFAVEAMQHILDEQPLFPEGIKAIRIRTHRNAKQGSDIPEVHSVLHARLSIQYGLAAVLLWGHAGLDAYAEEAVRDPRIPEIAKKVQIEVDPEIQRNYPNPRSMAVEVETTEGTRYRHRVDHAKGSPENPMSREELFGKFREITAGPVTADIQDNLIEQTMAMEEASSVTPLTALLAPGSPDRDTTRSERSRHHGTDHQ